VQGLGQLPLSGFDGDGQSPRGFDLIAGLRAAAAAVAMTVAGPPPRLDIVAVCTACGCVPERDGSSVDLLTALAGLRLVRFTHALCPDCFEDLRAGQATGT
jgi:hypothetical protein